MWPVFRNLIPDPFWNHFLRKVLRKQTQGSKLPLCMNELAGEKATSIQGGMHQPSIQYQLQWVTDWHRNPERMIIDECDDSDVDKRLQYSIGMKPVDHAILHSKPWLNDKV